jgi:hypothetical protein
MYLLNHGSFRFKESAIRGEGGLFCCISRGDRGYRRLGHGYMGMGWTGLGLARHSLFNAYCDTFFLIIFGLLGPWGGARRKAGIRRAPMLRIS